MAGRCQKLVLFVSILALFSMSACNALEERLEVGTRIAGQAPLDESNMTLEVPDLPEGEGVGGGASDDDDDGLEGSGAIGTSIQQTLDAMNAMTAEAKTPITPEATLTVPGAQLTALYQALTGVVETFTPMAEQTQSAIPTATFTPSPTPTNFTPTPTEAPCNAFRFVSHVNYFPGTIVQPDTGFFKIWSVQNIGSCTWTPSYSLVYHSGYQLGGRSPRYLSGYFQPGEFVQLGIQLYSNPQPGTYQSNWWLQDNQGIPFGGGENGNEPLNVEIIVPGQPQPFFTSVAVTPPPFYTSTPSP
jgi:hypothetical protein